MSSDESKSVIEQYEEFTSFTDGEVLILVATDLLLVVFRWNKKTWGAKLVPQVSMISVIIIKALYWEKVGE